MTAITETNRPALPLGTILAPFIPLAAFTLAALVIWFIAAAAPAVKALAVIGLLITAVVSALAWQGIRSFRDAAHANGIEG